MSGGKGEPQDLVTSCSLLRSFLHLLPDMPTPTQVAEKFNLIDAHDDTVERFVFHPAEKRGAKARVEVTLFRHWLGTRRVLTFTDCRNLDVEVDADVLRGNAPNNTAVLEATADVDEIAALMRRHRRSWNVSYDKTIDPMPDKLAAAGSSVLFRVKLFGGVLVVAARSFNIKRLRSDR